MKENLSPEEKLLKLIKGEKKPPAVKLALSAAAGAKKKFSIPKISLPSFIAGKYLIPDNIRKLMFALLAISFLYLLISFAYPWFGLNRVKPPEIPAQRIITPDIEQKANIKSLESYLGDFIQRQIFTNSAPQQGASAGVINSDLMKDINLVGVIAGENPQAVIEDKKTQKTYYVNKGQFMGEFQVEDIQEGKIILNYRGQRYELHM